MVGKAAPHRHAECCLQVSARREHWLPCLLEPFASSNAATTATCRLGRICDSIVRRGEGMGSLKRGCAAQQQQRFQQGSIPGNSGGPPALDALPTLEHSTDPVRWRRVDHEKDIRAVWWTGQGGRYLSSPRTLRTCAHPGRHVRSLMKHRGIRACHGVLRQCAGWNHQTEEGSHKIRCYWRQKVY